MRVTPRKRGAEDVGRISVSVIRRKPRAAGYSA
jgi:hypothetical protein